MNRLERLINLVAALLDAERPLGREEIFERVPGYDGGEATVRRAFERDKDALRSMGIPLAMDETDPIDGSVGYRIPREEYYLRDPGLTPEELAALHVAATTVRLEGAEGAEAIWKLGGAAGDGAPVPVAALPGSEHLATLFHAAGERRTVTFNYRGEPRNVDPHRLGFRAGHWYLAGFDHGRAADRSFRLDRITSAPVAGERGGFERPQDIAALPPRPWEMGDEEPVDARVLVDSDQAAWIIAELGTEALREQHDDGAVVVGMRVTNRAAFRSFVLGLLDHAEVLEPTSLRDEMVAWLEAIEGVELHP